MRVPVSVFVLLCLAAVAWLVSQNIYSVPIAPATAPTTAATPIPVAAVMETTPLPAEKEPPTATALEAVAKSFCILLGGW